MYRIIVEKPFLNDFKKLKLSEKEFNEIEKKLKETSKRDLQNLLNVKIPISNIKLYFDIAYRIFLVVRSETIHVISITKRNQDEAYKKEKIK